MLSRPMANVLHSKLGYETQKTIRKMLYQDEKSTYCYLEQLDIITKQYRLDIWMG